MYRSVRSCQRWMHLFYDQPNRLLRSQKMTRNDLPLHLAEVPSLISIPSSCAKLRNRKLRVLQVAPVLNPILAATKRNTSAPRNDVRSQDLLQRSRPRRRPRRRNFATFDYETTMLLIPLVMRMVRIQRSLSITALIFAVMVRRKGVRKSSLLESSLDHAPNLYHPTFTKSENKGIWQLPIQMILSLFLIPVQIKGWVILMLSKLPNHLGNFTKFKQHSSIRR